MLNENFPYDVLVVVLVRCTVRELACLSMTSRHLHERTRETLMHIYFQTASVTTDILSLVEANLANSKCMHYLTYLRNNSKCRIYARFPRLFKVVFEKKMTNDDGTELVLRHKAYANDSSSLIQIVKHRINCDLGAMNILLFSDDRKIHIVVC